MVGVEEKVEQCLLVGARLNMALVTITSRTNHIREVQQVSGNLTDRTAAPLLRAYREGLQHEIDDLRTTFKAAKEGCGWSPDPHFEAVLDRVLESTGDSNPTDLHDLALEALGDLRFRGGVAEGRVMFSGG